MKRFPLIFLGVLLLGGYLLVLAWSGRSFTSYTHLSDRLNLKKVEPVQLQSGEKAQLELVGSGFAENSRISLVMDVHHQEAIINRLPIPGYIVDMLLKGERLFIGNMHEGLQVFDVSDPLHPEFLWRSQRNWSVLDLEPIGELFALSCGVQGVRIIRETGQGTKTIGTIHWPGTVTESKHFANHLYVAANGDGLLVYDLANLESVKLVHQEAVGSSIRKMLIYQGYLYVSCGDRGVSIYDLEVPAEPRLINQIAADHVIYDIAIHNDELYLIDTGVGIRRYDLETPARPRHLKDLVVSGSPRWLSFSGELLFVADHSYGMTVIPLAEEDEADGYGYLDVGGSPKAKTMVGDYLYAGLNRAGLAVIDPQKIKPKQQLLSLDVADRAVDLAKDGRWLYVAGASSGLQVADLQEEKIVADLSGPGTLRLAREGKTLYLADKRNGVCIVDISDPYRPRQIQRFEPPSGILSLSVSGSRLMIAGVGGVLLYDVSVPRKPQLLDRLQFERATDAVIHGKTVYVTADRQGLVLLRITGDEKLKEIQRIRPPWPMSEFASAQALIVKGRFAYLANGGSGLLIVEVADPRQPKIVSSLQLQGFSYGLSVAGDFLSVGNRYQGVQYVDIQDPLRPKLLGSIRAHDVSRGVILDGGKIYLASGEQGVRVFPVPVRLSGVDRVSTHLMKVELPPVAHPGLYSLQITNGREWVAQDGVVRYLQ